MGPGIKKRELEKFIQKKVDTSFSSKKKEVEATQENVINQELGSAQKIGQTNYSMKMNRLIPFSEKINKEHNRTKSVSNALLVGFSSVKGPETILSPQF